MKKFTVHAQTAQGSQQVELYIGHPSEKFHPVYFQSTWMSSQRGITIPQNIIESLKQIQQLSIKNNMCFEELAAYAIDNAAAANDAAANEDDEK